MYYDDYRVETLRLEEIDRGDRARKDYKDVGSLANKIEDKGLLNPITVYERQSDYPDGQPYLLLAGGRRMKAHDILKYPKIACHIYDKMLSPLEIKSIELMENIDREDLEYIEEVNLKREIFDLQIAISGEKTSTKPGAPGVSMTDVAKMVGVTPASLSGDLKIARAMEQFPDLQWDRMKNKTEALKTINNIGNSINRMECAKVAERKLGTGDLLKKKLMDSFMVGDFFDLVEQTPDNYFDLVEVDPPYAINLQKVKKGYSYEGYNEIHPNKYPDFIQRTMDTCYRKMSDNSWMIFWFGPDPWFNLVADSLRVAGFNTTGLIGLWIKGEEKEDAMLTTSGQTHMPNSRLANAYEMFYYAWKGNPCLARPGATNVFGYKPVPPGKKSHPTERPLELMSDLLTTFGVEGSRILVPFAGSGTTLISAAQNKMIPLGFDLTQAYKDSYILRVDTIF
jgi:DNA modification methylase